MFGIPSQFSPNNTRNRKLNGNKIKVHRFGERLIRIISKP